MKQLALCSAGSHVGVHTNDASFPVGQIDQLILYPFSFFEFVTASDKKLSDYLYNFTVESKLPSLAHSKLMQELRNYYIVGGLP